jgi:hypothetical protein
MGLLGAAQEVVAGPAGARAARPKGHMMPSKERAPLRHERRLGIVFARLFARACLQVPRQAEGREENCRCRSRQLRGLLARQGQPSTEQGRCSLSRLLVSHNHTKHLMGQRGKPGGWASCLALCGSQGHAQAGPAAGAFAAPPALCAKSVHRPAMSESCPQSWARTPLAAPLAASCMKGAAYCGASSASTNADDMQPQGRSAAERCAQGAGLPHCWRLQAPPPAVADWRALSYCFCAPLDLRLGGVAPAVPGTYTGRQEVPLGPSGSGYLAGAFGCICRLRCVQHCSLLCGRRLRAVPGLQL